MVGRHVPAGGRRRVAADVRILVANRRIQRLTRVAAVRLRFVFRSDVVGRAPGKETKRGEKSKNGKFGIHANSLAAYDMHTNFSCEPA
jgi:hypothetical protein